MAETETRATCEGLLRDMEADAARLESAASCVKTLDSYHTLLSAVEKFTPEERRKCHGLGHSVTDRAYGAEAALRVLIAHSLGATNELRDGGQLYTALQDFAKA